MKKFILILISLFAFTLCFSQVTILNGHTDNTGSFVTDNSSELKNQFNWSISEDYSTVNCHVLSDDSIIDILVWSVEEIVKDVASYRYKVKSHDDREFIIDFSKRENSVVIFNQGTLEYSVMEGEGLYYE